jgi:hypothetical protein
MPSEYDGGTVLRECPDCGQFCHVPEHYHIKLVDGQHTDKVTGEVHTWKYPCGAYANSYCKRCKKKVKLGVVFI